MLQVKKIIAATILTCGLLITMIPTASAVTDYLSTCNSDYQDLNDSNFSFNKFIEGQAKNQGVDNFDITIARVVEISEPLPTSSSAVEGSFIINAYKGACCPKDKVNEETKQCKEFISLYASDYKECQAQSAEGQDMHCTPIQIIVSSTGINLLKFYALQLYIWGASLVGIIAVLVIVVSGIQIAASGGEDQMSTAKTRIMQSLAGLALLFLSALILYTINPTFFTN